MGRSNDLVGRELTSTNGLDDPGTTRDMTANRVGAWLGVELFRDPTQIPPILHDTGRTLPGVAAW